MEARTPRADGPDQSLAVAAKPPLSLVLLLGGLTALGPLGIDMYLPALPAISQGFGAEPAAAQQTLAVYLFGLAFGQLIYGPVSDRWGRKGPMIAGLALQILGSIGCMLAPSIGVLAAARLLQALGACGGMVLSRAIVRDRFPPAEILHVMSMLLLVFGLAPILAPLLGGWMLLVADWRAIFAFQAVFGLAIALAVVPMIPESRSEETAAHARTENAIKSYAALLNHRLLVAYMIAGGFSGAAIFTYVGSAPDVLIVQHHVPPEAFGWIFGFNAIGVIVSAQVNARLARRWPADLILRRALLFGGAAGLVMLAAAVTGFGGLPGVLIPLFLVISAYGFTQGNAQTEAMKIDPRRAGATAALLGAASFTAGSAGAALAGLLSNGSATPMAAVIFASFGMAWLALRLLAPARRRAA